MSVWKEEICTKECAPHLEEAALRFSRHSCFEGFRREDMGLTVLVFDSFKARARTGSSCIVHYVIVIQ